MKKKILITGGNGRFANELKKNFFGKNIFYLNKSTLNLANFKKIKFVIAKIKPKIIIHLAALSRPMKIHETNISSSIVNNIIATANLVRACSEKKIKLVHFSTHYVYPGFDGNYKETDALLPFNNYGWSKLGAECSVQLYLRNSLILRVAMYEEPFVHQKAFTNRISNFLSHSQVAQILPSLLKYTGVINIGGKKRTIYEFAKNSNRNVRKTKYNIAQDEFYPRDTSINTKKMNSILKINS